MKYLLMLLYPLSDEKRDIVLLSYLLDMTDQEIANKLNIVRRTVQYKRTNSLKEMKRRMEVLEYGKKIRLNQLRIYYLFLQLNLLHLATWMQSIPCLNTTSVIFQL
jgi:DNA-binding CsgD family transcriptional regulator